MDFTTIVAGPVQAGPQSPVSKPGIGLTAGVGSVPAADAAADAGFASLVAEALDQMDGVSTAGPSWGATGESGEEVPLAEGEGDDESSVDAATLSVLIALATPVAIPASMPQPDAAGPGSPDVTAIDGAGTTGTASADAAAGRMAAVSATAAFGDALATAAPVAAAGQDAPLPVAAPEGPAAASDSEALAAATTETPSTPANAPASLAEPAAPPPAAAAPRAGQRPAAHPLRQALAAIAAAAPAAPTSTETAQTDAPTPTSRTAGTITIAPAAAAATTAGHDGRAAAVSRVDTSAVPQVAAFGAASDAGSAGDGSSDGARDGFAGAASALIRGAESRFDSQTFPASLSSPTEMTTAASLSSLGGLGAGLGAGFGAAGDTMLRAIDVPAAARFEQTLSSVDPDVRNLQAMVRTVRLFTAGNGAHEARLNLEPEHLGHVALTVRVEQGSVSAHFRAETPAAQRWIETHQQELRAGLREQGLEVKEVVVTTDPDGRRDRRQDAQPARPPRARRPQSADAPRFEVLV